MAQSDEYVLAFIRDKQDAKKEGVARGMKGVSVDFEIGFLLRLLDEKESILRSIEDGWND